MSDSTRIVDSSGNSINTGNPFPVSLTGSNATKITSDGTASGNTVGVFSTSITNNISNRYALTTQSAPLLFNGQSLDMQTNNIQGTIIPSAARTGSVNSSILTNYNARGVIVYLQVSAASGTGGLTLHFRGYDTTSFAYWLNVTPSAITTVTKKAYILYPGVIAPSSGTLDIFQFSNVALPRLWGIEIDAGDASSYTYQVDYSLLN